MKKSNSIEIKIVARFFRNLLACLLLSSLIPAVAISADELSEAEYYEVNVPLLRLRSAPKKKSKIVEKVRLGRIVKRSTFFAKTGKVKSKTGRTIKGKWIQVETRTGKSGYMFNAFLKKAMPKEIDYSSHDKSLFSCPPHLSDCQAKLSKELIKKNPEIIQASFAGYTVVNQDKTKHVFANNPDRAENLIIYTPIALFGKKRYLIVSVALFEGGAYVLYDRKTKKTLSLWDAPNLAPDGRHLLVSSYSLAHNPNGLQLVQLGSGKPKMSFSRAI